jgi:hypothetical protein
MSPCRLCAGWPSPVADAGWVAGWVQGLEGLPCLRVLDVSANRVDRLQGLAHLTRYAPRGAPRVPPPAPGCSHAGGGDGGDAHLATSRYPNIFPCA